MIKPLQKVSIPPIETEVYKYARGLIKELHNLGLTSKSDDKNLVKKFDRWLLKYNLKFQEKRK